MNKLTSDIMIELHVPNFELLKILRWFGFIVAWEKQPKNPNIKYLVMKKGTSILNFIMNELVNHSFF